VSEISGRAFGQQEQTDTPSGERPREASPRPRHRKSKRFPGMPDRGLAEDVDVPLKVTVGKSGRVTLPAFIRDQLELGEGSELSVQVVAERLVLTPVVSVTRDYAWAYKPEHLERLKMALADVDEGRVRPLDEEELLRVLGS